MNYGLWALVILFGLFLVAAPVNAMVKAYSWPILVFYPIIAAATIFIYFKVLKKKEVLKIGKVSKKK